MVRKLKAPALFRSSKSGKKYRAQVNKTFKQVFSGRVDKAVKSRNRRMAKRRKKIFG